jgi:phosphoglucosamine mutase
MQRRYFGTDGIRGQANTWPMTAVTALKVGLAASRIFTRGNHRHRVVIAKDTRLSGYMLEAALVSGFTAGGMDVVLVGPMPTPAVAMLTRSMRADLGVMLSASHNAYPDNGIKLFGPDGFKLSDEIEAEIETHIENGAEASLAAPEKIGRARRLDDALGRYIEFVKRTFPGGRQLTGLKVVVDCANGAAYRVAPTVLWELEAEVVPVGVDPDGFNINKGCGSTAPGLMCEQVVTHGADLGIALDGDADRVVLADEHGQVVDGDQLMAAITRAYVEGGRLAGGGLVATIMSNLGLERFVESLGLHLRRTQVGDRYVVEAMRQHGYNVGGEQSGHIVLGNYSTTGDGLIAALQVLALVAAADRPVSEVCRCFQPLPQILKNVRFAGVSPLADPAVERAIEQRRAALGKQGRIVIRPSGTEPLIRVMAEGEDQATIERIVDELCEIIADAAGPAEAAQ